VSNGKPIPLTLTLSRGEREQPAAGSVVREVRRADTALGCAENQRRILPLPGGPVLRSSPVEHGPVLRTPVGILQAAGRSSTAEGGEGWGEGEGDARSANRVSTSPEVC